MNEYTNLKKIISHKFMYLFLTVRFQTWTVISIVSLLFSIISTVSPFSGR